MLFCGQSDAKNMEKVGDSALSASFVAWGTRTNKEILACVLVTHTEQRLIDVRKLCRKLGLASIEVFYAVHLFKLCDKCLELFGVPLYEKGEKIAKVQNTNKNFNNRMLVDFAISHQITDALTLMYEYAHLADPCDRTNCTKDHEDDHGNENENAKIFVALSDRKRCAKNACDCVVAKLYAQLKSLSNIQWLEMRCRELGDRVTERVDIESVGLAWYYSHFVIGLSTFRLITKFIMNAFMYNEPKKRYCALVGTFNSGKTSFAGAVCTFFEGVNINVNITKDRLPFYLGSAIGKRFVLFDDVKGRTFRYPPALPKGNGLDNLDDMRDHLDGHVDVQLEKKNQNPVEQRFPCGVITMNRYIIPKSLKQRVTVFPFKRSPLFCKHPVRITMETIFVAMALDNLVPCEAYVLDELANSLSAWKDKHRGCDCLNQQVRIYCYAFVVLCCPKYGLPMGGIIAGLFAAAVPLIEVLLATTAESLVVWAGVEGIVGLTSAIASIGAAAVVDAVVPFAVNAVVNAFAPSVIASLLGTFAGALLIGTAAGIAIGEGLPGATKSRNDTLINYVNSVKPLIQRIGVPLVKYVGNGLIQRSFLYPGDFPGTKVRVQYRESDGQGPVPSNAANRVHKGPGRLVLHSKRKAPASRQVDRKKQRNVRRK